MNQIIKLSSNCVQLFRSDAGGKIQLIAELPFAEKETSALAREFQSAIRNSQFNSRSGFFVLLGFDICLTHTVQLETYIRRNESAALIALEQYFPIDAEDLLATISQNSDVQLAVATKRSLIELIIKLTESGGFRINGIYPLSMLLAQNEVSKRREPNQILVMDDSHHAELIVIKERQPVHWSVCSQTGVSDTEIAAACGVLGIEQTNCQIRKIGNDIGGSNEEYNHHRLQQVASLLSDIQKSKTVGWFNFLPALKKQLGTVEAISASTCFVLMAGLLLMVSIAAAFYWQSFTWRHMASEIELSKTRLYRQSFPGKQPPRSIERAFRNQVEKLESLETLSESAQVNRHITTLLREMLPALQSNEPFRINNIAMVGSAATVEGEVKSTETLNEIVSQLEAKGFNVQSPRFGTSFRLNVSLNRAEAVHP
jgi:hypothetical protein